MEIKAFKAFRFNSDVVGNAGDCIAPPYDVISDIEQQNLYNKNPYNIVRITKGKLKPSDSKNDNQYTRAAKYLNEWIQKNALKQDDKDTVYGYVQDFTMNEKKIQRLSFIALAKLEPFGKIVRPHEEILKKPMEDRLNLERATSAKFGLVFMLYDDPDLIADKIIEDASDKDKSLIDFVDEQGVRHRLYAIIDKKNISAITNLMAEKSCIIADGHHRYTTGLVYAEENPDKPAAKYQMLAFSNTKHKGLIVLATHRLVANVENFSTEKLLSNLKEDFQITEYPFSSEKEKFAAREKMLKYMHSQYEKNKNAFGIYTAAGAFYVAVLKNPSAIDPLAPNMSKAWRSLDVSILHKLILEKYLGIDAVKLAGKTNLEYVKDVPSAVIDSIDKVDKAQKQAAFFMNPPKLEHIKAVADNGERMPQKSTYFYPKVFSGLTINKL